MVSSVLCRFISMEHKCGIVHLPSGKPSRSVSLDTANVKGTLYTSHLLALVSFMNIKT